MSRPIVEWLLAHSRKPAPEGSFRRGDANADGSHDIADGVFILQFLFAGDVEPSCLKSVDSDDDGTPTITDALYLLNFLFSGGAAPPVPLGECGMDPTEDELTCQSYPACEQ